MQDHLRIDRNRNSIEEYEVEKNIKENETDKYQSFYDGLKFDESNYASTSNYDEKIDEKFHFDSNQKDKDK